MCATPVTLQRSSNGLDWKSTKSLKRSMKGAHLDVVSPICDVLYDNLFNTRLLAAMLSRVVIRLISSEEGVFLLSPGCSSTAVVGGDLSTWWVESWNEVQAAFPTLILGRMHHRGACRILAHRTHISLRPAIGKSIGLCIWHRSVNCAAGVIIKCCQSISMVSCAI